MATEASGLTIEMVNEMQDEMNKIDGIDKSQEELDAEAATKAAEDAKLAEAKALKDAEDAANVEKDKKAAGDKAQDEPVDDVRELKEQLRINNLALKQATSDYQKLQKIMIDKGLITDEEVQASKVEAEKQQQLFAARQEKLTEMVTIMELNPAYTDVREVCSQSNLDDLVEAFARYYVKENGGSLTEATNNITAEIWSEANPYKKIYELVKTYHPKYVKKEDDKSEADKVKAAEETAKKAAAEADKVKKKEVKEVQDSAANIGAGGSGAGATGWTVARIDALPEDELSTVPKDIYEKYLKGLLT